MKSKLIPISAICLCTLASSVFAADTATKSEAPGKLVFDARWRMESVDDESFARDAFADTLRLRLGYQTGTSHGFSGTVVLEGTSNILSDSFNSTANGNTQYPVIADPNAYEVDLAFLSYAPNEHGKFNLGRQRIIIDNQRFFGNVGWRQNEQTFDAIDLNYKFGKNFTVRYDYINRVQRVFGEQNPDKNLARWDLNLNLFHADYAFKLGTLTGYAYLNENETLPLTSQKNFGARYAINKTAANGVGWLGTAEYAKQDSYADGASYIDADYLFLEGGVVYKGNTFKAGYEQLGGDGKYGFQTPFATLHAFNGWADKFLSTPKNGLQDTYLSWNRKFGKLGATVAYHDFNSDFANLDYGSEWDASVSWALAKKWTLLAKLADYQADQYQADTTKLWFSMEYVY